MASKQCQQTASSTVSGPQSLVLLKNMLRLSVSSICYIRSIFPSECFSSKDYAGLKVHQLECAEKTPDGEINIRYPEAFLLTQWLERGVFEALEKHYLKSLSFAVFVKHPKTGDETLLESYQFVVNYPDGQSATLNGVPTTKDNLKKQAVTFIRCLVEFTNTLEELPEERWLSMKLLYYDDKTPAEYEPEYFKAADSEIFKFNGNPLKIKIGKLETPYHTLQLKFTGMDVESLLIDPPIINISKVTTTSKPTSNIFHSNKNKNVEEDLLVQDMNKLSTSKDNTKDNNQSNVTSTALPVDTAANTVTQFKTPEETSFNTIRQFVVSQGKASVKDCATALKLKENEVRSAFKRMVTDGLIKNKGKGYIVRLPSEYHTPVRENLLSEMQSTVNENSQLTDRTQDQNDKQNKRQGENGEARTRLLAMANKRRIVQDTESIDNNHDYEEDEKDDEEESATEIDEDATCTDDFTPKCNATYKHTTLKTATTNPSKRIRAANGSGHGDVHKTAPSSALSPQLHTAQGQGQGQGVTPDFNVQAQQGQLGDGMLLSQDSNALIPVKCSVVRDPLLQGLRK